MKISIVFKSSCLCCFPSIQLKLSCKEIWCFQISSGGQIDQINDLRNPTKPIIGAELLAVSPSSNSYGDYTLSPGLHLSIQGHWIQEKHITCIINTFTAANARSLNTRETSNPNHCGRYVLTTSLQLSIQGHWIVNKHPTKTVMTIERWITRLQVPLKGHMPLNSSPPSN